MKRQRILFAFFLCFQSLVGIAQNVGINTTGASPDSSAMLDITSSDKGLLIPRMDSIARKNIVNPAHGLMVFDSTYNSFWYFNGIAWSQMIALDEQQLSLVNDSLWLTNDVNPVDLTGYRQHLSLSNDTLYLSNNNTPIDLSPYKDNFGNHIATQNIQLNGHMINNDGDANEGIYVDTAGHVGFNHAGATDALLQIGTAPGTVYKLKEDGFLINEYTLPTTAGNTNEILMTDGNGNVSWVNPITQGLGDTLGNHIATQNITSGGNWINQNGVASTGIHLDNSGQMGINIVPQANFHVSMGVASPGFRVTDTAVTVNEYHFPVTDGAIDESLITDGAGNLSWIKLTGANNQQLSLTNDTLALTNGGAPISLSPYLDADDLGNHTATQNLVLGTHKIQHNNSSNPNHGIYFGANNNLMVEADILRPAHFKSNFSYPNVSGYIEVRNQEGTRALLGPDGNGYTGGDDVDVVLANWTNGDLQFLTQGMQRMYISDVGNVGIGRNPITNSLEVEGDASKSAAGDWLANSDQRLKKNIQVLDAKKMLEKLLALQGITYEWNDQQTGTHRPIGLQYGFTAQNIQEHFPSLVSEDQQGYLQTPYGTYDAITVEAIRALKSKVDQLKERNASLKNRLQEVTAWKAEIQNPNQN